MCDHCRSKERRDEMGSQFGFPITFCPNCGRFLAGKSLEERKEDFTNTLKPYVSDENREDMNNFFRYWSATSAKNPQLMAFEREKSWNLEGRLRTWFKNKKSWSIVSQLRK